MNIISTDDVKFTKEEFSNLDQEIVDFVFDAFQDQNSAIDNLIIMGQQLKELIEQEMPKVTDYSKITNTQISSFISKSNKSRMQAIMIMGATYVFRLRTFLLDDSISFILGSIFIDEENKQQQPLLQNIILTQEEMLKNVRASFNKSAIVLSHNLQRLENLEQRKEIDVDETEVWNMIQRAASVEGDYDRYKSGKKAIYKVLNKKRRRIYQSPDKDTNVYFRFSGKLHQISKYYSPNGNNLKYFNNGWLYEWFQAKIVAEGAVNELKQQMDKNKEHPLAPIFDGVQMDDVKGIQGGDFSLGKGKGSMQAKFGNDKIISFVNIIQELYKITIILENFKNLQKEKNVQETAEEILNLFSHESLRDSLARGTAGTINRLVEEILPQIQRI